MANPSPLLQGGDANANRTANIHKAWHRLVAEREDNHKDHYHDDVGDERDALPHYIEAEAFADHYLAALQASTSTSTQHTPNTADPLPFQPLRSIHYALTLRALPPQSTVHGWIQAAQQHRAEYARLRAEAYRAPDGTLPDDIEAGPSHDSAHLPAHTHLDWSHNNPLTPDTDAWTAHFEKRQLQKTILSDVTRCFPELPVLRHPHTQTALSRILFAWATLHPTIGYRQGMHDLAGALLVARLADSVSQKQPPPSSPSALQILLDERYIEHDTYIVFSQLMDHLVELYEWQDHPGVGGSNTTLPVTAWRPPIIQRSNHIFDRLKYVDPALSLHLTATMSIEPQLFLLRWLRLLFLREFPLVHALELWDSVFAAAIKGNVPIMDLVDWICIAHLLRLRNRLLVDSQTLVLQTLLHPLVDDTGEIEDGRSPSSTNASTSSRSIPPQAPGYPPHHTPLLTLQARQLHSAPAPSPQLGVQCVMQNATLLRIPINASHAQQADQEHDTTEPDSTPPQSRAQAQTTGYGRRPRSRVPAQSPVMSPSPTTPPVTAGGGGGSLSDLARNLYLRSGADEMIAHANARARHDQQPLSPSSISLSGESSNASDLIKWVGTWTSALGPRGTASAHSTSSGFPDRLSELERDRREARLAPGPVVDPAATSGSPTSTPIDTLRSQNQRLGSALQDVVTTFERHWVNESESERDSDCDAHAKSKSQMHTLRALTTLKHVRDLLLQGGGQFEDGLVDAFPSPSPSPINEGDSRIPVSRLTRTPISPPDPQSIIGGDGRDAHPQQMSVPVPPQTTDSTTTSTATSAAARTAARTASASDPLGVL